MHPSNTMKPRLGPRRPAHLVGIDFGNVNVKLVLFAPNSDPRSPRHVLSRPSRGRPHEAALRLIDAASALTEKDHSVKLCVTGAATPTMTPDRVGTLLQVNEVVSVAAAVSRWHPDVRTVFDLGGGFSKWIEIDTQAADPFARVSDFAMNGLCAAGSGTFMDQQASRLGMSPEALARAAVSAKKGAVVAGRCSVFAKSDMIHLQQKGTPVDEIAYGLCLALARTFVRTVLRGRRVAPPIAFVGGGASNPGLLRAFVEVLGIDAKEIATVPFSQFASAWGAAMFAERAPVLSFDEMRDALTAAHAPVEKTDVRALVPLRPPQAPHNRDRTVSVSPDNRPRDRDETGRLFVHMGIDVGSVSTNVALLGPDLTLIDSTYVPTAGQPIRALNRSFDILKKRFGERLNVHSVGATGSGRHLVERIAGADLVKNEITAQLESALHCVPGADTVFEIGGQDSKYIRMASGRLDDFEMNKICAAGTGSFLEEQAERLGVDIRGAFSALALKSTAPVDLGSKCTVFMDAELCKAMGNGSDIADLCAGLAYGVARNYLEKVVAGRDIGRKVVFQGGTSANAAVVSAFEALLGHPVTVHPHGTVSGAVGVAILAARAAPSQTAFLGFDACRAHTTKQFTCHACENRCRVNRVTAGRRIAHFGDVCEKYTVKDQTARGPVVETAPVPNLFEERAALLQAHLPDTAASGGPRIGLLKSTLSMELLPFFANLLHALGFTPVIPASSGPSETMGGLGVPEEACLPLKIAMAEVQSAFDTAGVERVLLPVLQHLPTRQKKDRPNTCLYAQFLPNLATLTYGDAVITPELSLFGEKAHETEAIAQLTRALSVSATAVRRAIRFARGRQTAFNRARVALGQKILRNLPVPAVVVLGKPYNLHDPAANLNLAAHLQKAGLFAIPMDLLPLDEPPLPASWQMLPWQLNRDQARALQRIGETPGLFPIHVSSYGCGPDAFALKHLAAAWGDRPRLFLEFDAHQGEAGLVTRIEAFADEIRNAALHPVAPSGVTHPTARPTATSQRGARALLPYTSPHVHAYAGALRAAGMETQILPPPTEESVRRGREVSSERECHPFTIIAGDLMTAVAASDLRADDRFFLPGTRLPCLLSQYGDGFRKILQKQGLAAPRIFDPHPGELGDLIGVPGFVRLYEGLTLVDILFAAHWLLRPRAVDRGQLTDAIENGYHHVAEGLAHHQPMRRVLRGCLEEILAVPLGPPIDGPIVGVTGDLYTRLNAAGNAHLFERLASHGCTVWPSPFFAAGIDFELPQDARRWRAQRAYTRALKEASSAAVLKHRANRLTALLPERLRERCVEPPFAVLQQRAEKYVKGNTNHLIRGLVAKMADFAARGADGVVSAIGVGCMVGVCASGVIDVIRKDYDNVPIISIAYGGGEGPSQQIQLETFIHQVHQRFEKRRSATCTANTGTHPAR